jgi:6-phosphogluconolactonase
VRFALITVADGEAMAQHAAACLTDILTAAVRRRGWATLALAGGATPRALYRALTQTPHVTHTPWQAVDVFWSDERCVAPDQPDSNVGMARATLLHQLALPAANIHAPDMTLPPPEAAQAYEQHIRMFFAARLQVLRAPFDAVLLGIGTDGHTASLFPGQAGLSETIRWVVAATPPADTAPAVARITFTLPLIAQAEHVLMLATGPAKRAIVDAMVHQPAQAAWRYPAARVTAQRELLLFYAPIEARP